MPRCGNISWHVIKGQQGYPACIHTPVTLMHFNMQVNYLMPYYHLEELAKLSTLGRQQDPCTICLGIIHKAAHLIDLNLVITMFLLQGKKGTSGFPGINGFPGIKVISLGSTTPGSEK